jgi:hypothetical protein
MSIQVSLSKIVYLDSTYGNLYNKMIWVLCVNLVYTLHSSFHILLDKKYPESQCQCVQWYITDYELLSTPLLP